MLTDPPERSFDIRVTGTSGIEDVFCVEGATSVSDAVEVFLREYLRNGRLKVDIEETTLERRRI